MTMHQKVSQQGFIAWRESDSGPRMYLGNSLRWWWTEDPAKATLFRTAASARDQEARQPIGPSGRMASCVQEIAIEVVLRPLPYRSRETA